MTSVRGDYWRGNLMKCEGVEYVQLHSSTHGTVKTNDGRLFDFWPSTANWKERTATVSETNNGLAQLFNVIKGVKPEVKAEAHQSDLRVKLLNVQLGSVLRELAFLRTELQELRAELGR